MQEHTAESATSPQPPAATTAHLPLSAREFFLSALFASMVYGAAFALFLSAKFRGWLPIPEGWGRFESILFPISAVNLAFHEAGHWIFGVLGWDFLTTLGGTLMQLAMPAACLVHFLRRSNRIGVFAMVVWVGMNLINIAWYAADAKMQVLILITGASGSESGMHDWGNMLGPMGLIEYGVLIGQVFFTFGCWLMSFPFILGLLSALKRLGLPVAGFRMS